MLTAEDVGKHASRESCWVIIKAQAYDCTDFLEFHPGGANSILRCAGKDATLEYEPLHPPGTIQKYLPAEKHLGSVELSDSSGSQNERTRPGIGSEATQTPLPILQNLDDFEVEARKHLAQKAWVYYSSAAESSASHRSNLRDWERIHLRPRVLRDVAQVSMKRTIMGYQSALPFFIAPAALAKLGHEDGELCLASGAARYDIPYCSSTYSSVAHGDIASRLQSEGKGGALLFQLYVPIIKQNARNLIAEARRLGFKALVVTVDSAVVGKREEDDRYKAQLDYEAGIDVSRTRDADHTKSAPILRGAHSSTFEWEDLAWIREEWAGAGPIILKGIQTVEDAVYAAEAGVQGIYLSNHGGRQLDHAPSSLRTLLEIRKYAPQVFMKLEVYLDGGVRRGTDVIKALALGAQAVGLGRPFMYALSGYGTQGVCTAMQLLSDEIETAMRLMGVTDLGQLNATHANAASLELELARDVELVRGKLSKL